MDGPDVMAGKSKPGASKAEDFGSQADTLMERLTLALKNKRYKQAIPSLQYLIEVDYHKALNFKSSNNCHLDIAFLHHAIEGNHVDVVRFLIDECGCDPTDFNKSGCGNSYDIAIEYESLDVLKYLIKNHKPTRVVAEKLFSKAVKHVDSLKCLINSGIINPVYRYNFYGTILHWAASDGSIDVLKYLVNECNCDPMNNDRGVKLTPLHLATFNGRSEAIEFLLSTGKCDPMAKDEDGKTPLDFTKGNIKTRSIFKKFGQIKTSFPVDSYVNVLIVGNPGAGKSTLNHVIIGTATGSFVLGSFRNVGGVVPCTAGIIPYKLQHRTLGNIILHDFAGHSEYYSSHSAVIENLLQGSGGVFLIVVNILEKEAVKQLHQWLTVVRNEAQKALNQCRIIVVVSHVDEINNSVQRRRKEEIQEIIVRERCDSISLDCRKLGGNDVGSFLKKLSSACQFLCSTSERNLSLYCHMMYGLLEQKKENILTLSDVLSAAKATNSYVLPDNREEVLDILHSLHSTGLISIFKHEYKTWVVVNKGILLTEVNGVLFAPETFKEHVNIASNTGIINVSGLTRLFSKYDPDMLIYFLKNMELCQEIHPSFLKLTNLYQVGRKVKKEGRTERLLYFPCLLNMKRPKEMTSQVYQFGWCLQCTNKHHFFPPRYFHVLSLHLAFKMALPQEDDKLNRRCTFWRNGLYWFNGHGVGSLVEIVDESQCVLVMMSCEEGCSDNMVSLRRDMIGEVMSVYKESCPSLEVKELVIDPKELAYPVNTPRERTVYSVKDILSAIKNREEFVVNAAGIRYKKVKQILPYESLLVISKISLLGGYGDDIEVIDSFSYYKYSSMFIVLFIGRWSGEV